MLGEVLHPITEIDVLAALGDVEDGFGDREAAHAHRVRALAVAEEYDLRSTRWRADRIRRARGIAAEST